MVRVRIPGAVNGVIKGAGVLDEISDFIANPPPTPVGGAIGRAGQRFCDALAASPALAYGLLQSQGVIGSIVCEPYYEGSPFDPPELGAPPFTGGQCATVYSVLAEFTGASTGGQPQQAGPGNVNGPITGITSRPDFFDPNRVDIFVTSGAPGNPDVRFVQSVINEELSFRIISVTRVDGNPDDCGDPESEIQPGPNPPSFPVDYQPGIDFGLDDEGQPFIDVPGIPDPITGNPIPFEDPFAPLTGEPGLPQPTGDNQPGESDSIGNPVGDAVQGDSGENVDFGQPPVGKIWVGCLVEFSVDPNYGNVPNTGPENTVYPLIVGNVSLRYGDVFGTPKQVRSRFTEVFRPNTAMEVTGAFIQTRPNTTAVVRPISITVCKDVRCSGE